MGIKRILFCMIFVISLALPVCVLGQGYILSAKNGISNPHIIPLYEDAGLYYCSDKELAQNLFNNNEIEYFEEDILVEASPEPLAPMLFSANDTLKSWHISEPETDCLSLFKLDGTGVKIGIVDSGINAHNDLPATKIVASENFTTDENDNIISDIKDYDNHGTAVASVICGQGVLGSGAVGVAPGAELVSAKWCVGKKGYVSDIIKAFDYCDEQGCDIINMSLGIEQEISDYTQYEVLVSLKQAIDTATEKNIIVVAAVGNGGSSSNTYDFVSYPAGFSNVIGVASVGTGFTHSAFSRENESVFISAPGNAVYLASCDDEAGYTYQNGTSFATPYVSGLVALIKQVYPDANTERVKEILKECVIDLGEEGYDESFGHGIVNGRALAKYLRKTNIFTYHEDDGIYGISLDGDKTVLKLSKTYDGQKPSFEVDEVLAKDKTKTLLGKTQDDGKTRFLWEKESLKPLCSSY